MPLVLLPALAGVVAAVCFEVLGVVSGVVVGLVGLLWLFHQLEGRPRRVRELAVGSAFAGFLLALIGFGLARDVHLLNEGHQITGTVVSYEESVRPKRRGRFGRRSSGRQQFLHQVSVEGRSRRVALSKPVLPGTQVEFRYDPAEPAKLVVSDPELSLTSSPSARSIFNRSSVLSFLALAILAAWGLYRWQNRKGRKPHES